jgi:hypothetical protein
MKISKDLKQQVERYGRTSSFNLNNVTKNELAAWYKDTQNKTLNISCGTCLRNAMRDIVAWSKQGLKQPAIRRIPFKGIVEEKPKTIAEMTYKELRAMAKEQGIKGTLKREEYIALLSNA